MHTPDDRSFFTLYDGTSMLFRSYYGMRSFLSPDGVEVGGVFGVGQTLVSMMRRQRPHNCAVVFDAGQRTFRNEIYAQYKANRGEPPEDLIPQFDLVQEMIRSLGFRCYCVPGYEADDLIATLTSLARKSGFGTRIVSVDKDICQLVTDQQPPVVIYHAQKRLFYNEAGVFERMGVKSSQAIDYQALVGDSTDNIPGIKGVGPKAAQALLDSFENIDAIYADIDRVQTLSFRGAKSLAKKLEAGREQVAIARQLVTLKHDVPIDTTIASFADETRWEGPMINADGFFDQLGFHRPLYQLRELYRQEY